MRRLRPIRVRGINHVTLSVSDVKRSVDFYQGLFGMPVISRQGMTTNLQIGAGPQFLGVSSAGAARRASTTSASGVDDFNVDRITAVLGQRGITRTDEAGNAGGGGLGGGPLKMRVRMRGPDTGGTREGTPELYFSDPDGVVMQLQDPRYCGGGGALGNVCAPAGAVAEEGADRAARLEPLHDLRLGRRSCEQLLSGSPRAFASRRTRGRPRRCSASAACQFLMFAGGGGRGRRAAAPGPAGSINHLCMNMDGFNPDAVIKTLESYGIKPRGSAQGPAGPLVHYISMRMENRGGAKEGTPELYFTGPGRPADPAAGHEILRRSRRARARSVRARGLGA